MMRIQVFIQYLADQFHYSYQVLIKLIYLGVIYKTYFVI